jgi:mRNA degradation ribonuclease J1/J2
MRVEVIGSMESGGGTCFLVKTRNGPPIVIDCGANPGDCNSPVNQQIISAVIDNQPGVVAATHFHFDHVGGLVKVAEKVAERGIPYPTIVSTPFTFRLLQAHINSRWMFVGHKIRTKRVSLVPVRHSVPESAGVLVQDDKTVFYTGDFYGIDLPATLPRVDLLIVDSTGALRDTPRADNEDKIRQNIIGLISQTLWNNNQARAYVALFSTQLERAAYLQDGVEHLGGWPAAVKGASLWQNMNCFKPIRTNSRSRVTLATGVWAQGEDKRFGDDASALVKIANGYHRDCQLRMGDLVILSGSIPTWAPRLLPPIESMCRKLKALGARVVVDTTAPESWEEFAERQKIHAGGHGNMPEITELIERVKPRMVMPFHASPEARAKIATWCKGQGYAVANGQDITL